MPATPSRPCRAPTRKRSSRCAPRRFRPSAKTGSAAIETVAGSGTRGPFEFREGRDPEIRPARTDGRQDRRLGRPRPAVGRELQEVHRAGGRQARRGRRRQPRRRRRRLHAQRLPGRADRQGGGAGALHRGRHFGRHPASRRHEGQQGDRRDQQGRRGADLPGRRLRPGGRPVPGAARAERRTGEGGQVTPGNQERSGG